MNLRPYQEAAADRMVREGRLYLAFRPRMGKTPTTISALVRRRVERPLVICPAVVRPVWEDHFQEWAPASVRPTVISYEQLVRGGEVYADALAHEVDAVVVDEVHYAARTGAKRTRYAMWVANHALRARAIYVLSGSPIRNRPLDLYPPLRAIWPDVLRAYGVLRRADFEQTFEEALPVFGHRHASPVRARNVPLLRAILDRVMIRTSPEEVAEQLPPLAWDILPITLPPSDAAWMEANLQGIEGYEEIVAAVARGETPGDEDGAVASARRILGTAKALPATRIIAEELEAGLLRKVVVGAYHHDVIDVLYQQLRAYGCVRITGRTPPHERELARRQFQHDTPRVMIAQLTAAGVGIDLSAADDVVLVEQDWVPETNAQFVDRVRHPDKDHPCTVREIVVNGSIDSAIAATRRRKLRIIGQIVYGRDAP